MGSIYLAGKITGDPNYREKFQRAKAAAESDTVLDPSMLPNGLSLADYMRVCFAMIDTADQVMFLPDFMDSPGSMLELSYCRYIKKTVTFLAEVPSPDTEPNTESEPEPTTVTKPKLKLVSPPTTAGQIEPYTGFVFIRCPHCKKEHAFCLRTQITECTCRDCGCKFDLPPATVAITRCECGNSSKYLTNVGDWYFDIPCVTCGSPCTVEYRPNKNRYEPVGSRGTWKKKRRSHETR